MVFNCDDNINEERMEEGDDSPPMVLIKADTTGVTILTSLLKTINFCEKVNVFITMAGLRFVVEEGKYVQAVLHMKSDVFKTFNVRVDGVGFKIPFKELLDCMKILGADGKIGASGGGDATDGTVAGVGGGGANAIPRSLQITYNGHGTPFCLALEEPAMFTEIELKTEDLDHLMDFDELEKQWEIIMDAKLLQEFLIDLEGYAPEQVTLRVVPNTCAEIRANGVAGSLKITIPKNCTGVERFCSVKETHQAHYKFSVLRHSFKLIQVADKVIIRMTDQDVLNLNIVFRDTLATYGDFYVMPMADIDLDDFSSDNVDH